MNKDTNNDIATYFKALGHPVRVQIVQQLKHHGVCFSGDISSQLPVAASTASQHLKILKQAGVISGTVDGPRRCYCIKPEAFEALEDWLRNF